MTSTNPKAALDALGAGRGSVTLGKIAILDRMRAPILQGRYDDLNATLAALYVVERPLADSVDNFGRLGDLAVLYFDGIGPDEYRAKLGDALDGIAAFFEMLPRPSPDAKKNSATDGAQSSASGSAGPTAGE